MNFRGFRVQIALLSFLVLFTVGLGVQYLHEQTRVILPLMEELQNIPGILRVDLEKAPMRSNKRTLVSLEMEQNASLALVLEEVYQTLTSTGGEYAIRVQDTPNSMLLSLFQRIQIALEEAIMTGEFTILEDRIEELASMEGVDWQLGLDREYIYLSLQQGTNNLRRVISRNSIAGQFEFVTEGGVQS